MRWFVLVATFAGALALLACDKGGGAGTEGSQGATGTPAPGKTETPPAPGAEAQPADPAASAADQPADPAGAPEPPATPPESAGVEASGKTAVNKETLAKAYEEIYCAQKMGRTDQILDIYKKYGFESPKQWTEAWAATSEDVQWQADLTRRVQSAECK
jgi:hypothetical protein